MASNETITVRITDLSRGGAGVAREDSGRVIFVPWSAPGDVLRVRILKEEKRHAQAELVEILEASPIRQQAPCPVFARCGGCQWQHIPYGVQWETKVKGARHALSRVGIDAPASFEEFPAERIWNYRNRVQMRGESGALGYFAAGTNELVALDPNVGCKIARPEINEALPAVVSEGVLLSGSQRKPYKVEIEVLESGAIRKSWNSRHGVAGFRQIHDDQNLKLREWVSSAITPGRPLLDLYGGAGNLSLPLAERMSRVDCVDINVPTEAPKEPHDQPAHFYFQKSDVLSWLLKRAEKPSKSEPTSALMDPPRIGLDRDFGDIESSLRKLGVNELVLVGCDLDSWVKDLVRFKQRGWQLTKVAVIDFFPQTPHIESVALLNLL